MNKLIDNINKKENTIMVICIILIAVCIIFLVFTRASEKLERKFNFKENLEENVLNISTDDSNLVNISLKEFSYYIIVAEANTQAQALVFNPDYPDRYWNLKTSPMSDLRHDTKKFCIDACIRDNLVYLEATSLGYTLTEDELDSVKDTSYDIYTHLTAEQVDATSIDYEDLFKVQKKLYLSEKYVLSLLEKGDIKEKSELSADGTYYLEHIKAHYNIEENNSILDNILFGNITVNVEKEVK